MSDESGTTGRAKAASLVTAGMVFAVGAAVVLIALPAGYRRWWGVGLGCLLLLAAVAGAGRALVPRDGNVGFGIVPRLQLFDARMRSALAFVLVVGTLGVVTSGILLGTPAAELAQYLTPISGLAGLAVGYYFGKSNSGT